MRWVVICQSKIHGENVLVLRDCKSWFIRLTIAPTVGKIIYKTKILFMYNHWQGHVSREGKRVSLSMHPLTFPIMTNFPTVVPSLTLAHVIKTTRKLTRKRRCSKDHQAMVHKQHKTNFVTWGLFFYLYFLLFIYSCP